MCKRAILSPEKPEYADMLRGMGYAVFPTQEITGFLPFERYHADMQCLVMEEKTAFVLQTCTSLISALETNHQVIPCGKDVSGEYPKNVALNALAVGKTLIGRLDSLAPELIRFCEQNGYGLIYVKQGYTHCSCAVVGNRGVITADRGIYHSIQKYNETAPIHDRIDTLLISPGNIRLDGADFGFIGGASGYHPKSRKLYFCGNIELHPDFQEIEGFCERHNTDIICLSKGPLFDIGGIIFC